MNPLKLFFQDTALFLLRLVRHLVIQTIILIFVFVDGHVHELFRKPSPEKPTIEAPPRAPKKPKVKRNKSRKLRSNQPLPEPARVEKIPATRVSLSSQVWK